MKVFSSNSTEDKLFTRKLKRDLNLNYIDSWVDKDKLLPGDNLMGKI